MSKSLFGRLFPKRKPIIAMIHVFEGWRKRQIDQISLHLLRVIDAIAVSAYD